MMKTESLKRLGVGTLLATLSIAIQPSAQGQTITTFDPPGSISTTATSINQAGVITGYYIDASRLIHGFLRAATGGITTFDVPGSNDTFPFSINQAGVITGYYTNMSGQHGFVGTP
jgi:predicted membrane protein